MPFPHLAPRRWRVGALATVLAACVATVVGSTPPVSAAFPERTVTIIIAWPAGGATDLIGRATQEAFAKALGAQVIIKNIPGASGTIGTAEAAAAPADGYTLLVTPVGPIAIQPHRVKLTYDPSSFAPVCKMVDSPVVLMSPPGSRFKTMADVIGLAKADPGKIVYGSTGPGTVPHISMIALAKATDTSLKHVPYKGSAEVVQALLAGTVELFSDQPNLVAQYNLTPIAVYADKRLPGYKDTPTMKEAGVDLRFSIWSAMLAPKGTPAPVIARLEGACKAALEDKSVVDALGKQRQPIDFKDSKALGPFIEAEYKSARALIAEAGLLQK